MHNLRRGHLWRGNPSKADLNHFTSLLLETFILKPSCCSLNPYFFFFFYFCKLLRRRSQVLTIRAFCTVELCKYSVVNDGTSETTTRRWNEIEPLTLIKHLNRCFCQEWLALFFFLSGSAKDLPDQPCGSGPIALSVQCVMTTVIFLPGKCRQAPFPPPLCLIRCTTKLMRWNERRRASPSALPWLYGPSIT